MAKYFVYPFANTGDKTPIPEPTQGGGQVSYNQGWGPYYQLDLLTDPNALPIPRDQSNQLYYDITLAIQQYQQNGIPDFITTADNLGSPFAYPKYAQVRYDDGSGVKVYENQVAGNTALPSDPSWLVISGSPVPAGIMVPYAGATVPPGYLLCDGSAISRTTFAALFTAIGTVWGPGDGSTTFNIPAMARRTVMGSGGSPYPGVIGNALGDLGGSEGIVLTSGQLANHTHAAVPGYTYHGVKDGSGRLGFTTGGPAQTGGVNGASGQAHPNIQPSAIINWIIKT